MSKHTPGLWELLTFSNHELQTDFAMVKLGSRVHMVGYSDEDKANARLIAAAPDLLEALESMLQSFLITQSLDDYPIDAPCNKARAAIAKAKGEV